MTKYLHPRTKVCNTCHVAKDISEFYKSRDKRDGLGTICKACDKITCAAYEKTPEGVATKIYGHQKYGSKKRGHDMPEYSKSEFQAWLFQQPNWSTLFEAWVSSDYNSSFKPSVDRIDDTLSYTFKNIQLMTWIENNDKKLKDQRSGKLRAGSPMRAVLQLSPSGQKIKAHISAKAAERATGITSGSIGLVARGVNKHAGGFKWVFVDSL